MNNYYDKISLAIENYKAMKPGRYFGFVRDAYYEGARNELHFIVEYVEPNCNATKITLAKYYLGEKARYKTLSMLLPVLAYFSICKEELRIGITNERLAELCRLLAGNFVRIDAEINGNYKNVRIRIPE